MSQSNVPPIQAIPPYTIGGLLPPYVSVNATDFSGMSPYRCTLVESANRFATTTERVLIFRGLLQYRAQLFSFGLTGFQWLAGSYTEEIESLEGRAPRDVDVVTFLRKPISLRDEAALKQFFTAAAPLFDNAQTKPNYHCDAFGIDLDAGNPQFLVDQTRYWFGLFTHRRITNVWKGIVEVPLLQNGEDTSVADLLNRTDARLAASGGAQ
jgi:hypothetical protein